MGTPDRPTPRHVRSSDGIPIIYEVAGSGDPTLLLVHGWAFDRHLWRDHVGRLAARHRVITLDLPGHGETGGHSTGGPVVLDAARRMGARVRGIVLVDTVLNVEERMPSAIEQVIAASAGTRSRPS